MVQALFTHRMRKPGNAAASMEFTGRNPGGRLYVGEAGPSTKVLEPVNEGTPQAGHWSVEHSQEFLALETKDPVLPDLQV